MKKSKNKKLFKLLSLFFLTTSSMFATLYGVEYVKSNSDQPSLDKVYVSSFICDSCALGGRDVKFTKFDFTLTESQYGTGEKFVITASNIGFVLAYDTTTEGVLCSGSFSASTTLLPNDDPTCNFFVEKNASQIIFLPNAKYNDPALSIFPLSGDKTWNWEFPNQHTSEITIYPIYFPSPINKNPENIKYFYSSSNQKISLKTNYINNCNSN